jgi:hypothetical protein
MRGIGLLATDDPVAGTSALFGVHGSHRALAPEGGVGGGQRAVQIRD